MPASSDFSIPLQGGTLQESEFQQLFGQMRDAVLAKKPVLKEILMKHGSKKLYNYAKEYIDVNLNPPIEHRQTELLTIMHAETKRLLGQEVADSVVDQLKHEYFVSTADHHGPLTHPFFINSNLLIAAPFRDYQTSHLRNVIVLACANCSLGNSSFPRGIVLHGRNGDNVGYHGISFSASQYRLCPVYGFKAYSPADLKRVHDSVREKVTKGDLGKEPASKLDEILDSVFGSKDVFECTTYVDQITKINYHLWNRMMTDAGNPVQTNLVYLNIEKIVAELILAYHLDADTTVNHFLFDQTCYPMINHYFQGIAGTYSLLEQWGTYMFWVLPKGAKYREQLWKDGNTLKTKDGTFSMPFTPGAVRDGLRDGTLIPSTMLIYLVLSLYYGLKCLGGFSQVNYLTFMKNAYIKMQVDRGMYKSIEVCARAQTKEIVGDVNVAFLKLPDGKLAPATGIDLLLYGGKWWECFVRQSQIINLDEAMNPMMPELYKIIYPEGERDPRFNMLTTEDVTHFTGLDTKIEPCAVI